MRALSFLKWFVCVALPTAQSLQAGAGTACLASSVRGIRSWRWSARPMPLAELDAPALSSSSSVARFMSDAEAGSTEGSAAVPSTDDDKDRLVRAYRRASVIFGAMGAVLLVMPDRTMNTMVATKFGGAAGYGMAAGLCHILKGATEHDRLQSDTYRRLNLGLLGFSAVSLAAVPGETGFLPSFPPALVLTLVGTAARILGATVAWRGWTRGLDDRSARALWRDFVSGAAGTVRGLRVRERIQMAALYRNLLLLVVASCISSLIEGIFHIRFMKDLAFGGFEVSLQWSAVARLFMISTVIYSLKDAAERSRLQGTTFIQLNAMVAIWAILVGLGQAIYPLGFAPRRGALMLAFAFPFFTRSYYYAKLKIDKAKGST